MVAMDTLTCFWESEGFVKNAKGFFGLFFFCFAAWAQQPNCQINFGPWTDTATSTAFNNVGAGNNNQCTYWVMSYQVIGFSAISLQFESAIGGTNLNTPGTFGAFSGTVSLGVNPSTSVTCATVANCTAVFTGTVGWYRVNFVSHTGSGTITGTLKGYISGIPLGGQTPPSGTACPGTVATPCVVDGPDAPAAASTQNPVQIGLNDGAVVRRAVGDTSGRFVVVGSGPVGGGLGGNPVVAAVIDTLGNVRNMEAANAVASGNAGANLLAVARYDFNGATWDRAFVCPNTAAITFTAASGTVQIVGLVGGQIIRICSILLASDTVTNITLEYGTGALCAGGTTVLSGAIPNVLTFAMSWQPDTALRTAVSNAFCIVSSAVATIGGTITYAQF